MTEPVVDAEVVEETTVAEVEPTVKETHSTALEVRPASREVLMPMDTEQVVAGMEAYQELLPKLLKPSDWQDAGRDGKFVKKSGWRKIARAFNLSVMVVSVRVERDDAGLPTRAEAIARAQAPNGQVSDADGYCSADEKRFASEKGRQKLENDLRATATTRAKNRAISDLVGMGEVSAEEIDAGASVGPAVPPASKEQLDVLGKALNWFLPPEVAHATWDRIKNEICGGQITGHAALAVLATISAKKSFDSQDPDQAPPVPGDPPPQAESGTAVGASVPTPATEEPKESGDPREELEASK